MRHLWTVACKDIITDAETNNVTLINVIERINFRIATPGAVKMLLDPEQKEPVAIPITFTVVSTWWRDDLKIPESGKVRYHVQGTKGKIIPPVEQLELDIDLTSSISFRTNAVFDGVPYDGDGAYEVILQLKVNARWKEVASIPMLLFQGIKDKP